MAVNIVTGKVGEAHITSHDDKARNAEIFGKGKFVFDVGDRLWATQQGNTNVIEISNGMCMTKGAQMGIEYGDSETVTIESGAVGYQRIDLIVMRYQRDRVNDVESASLVVIKGDSMQQNPQPPAYEDNDILTTGDVDDVPLFKVTLNGTSIESIEAVYKLRTGYKPVDPHSQDPGTPEIDPTNTMVITAATVDELWQMSLQDGDSMMY